MGFLPRITYILLHILNLYTRDICVCSLLGPFSDFYIGYADTLVCYKYR